MIMRHTYAGEAILDDTTADDARKILPDGRDQLQRLAEWLDANSLIPAAIYVSPIMRTKQSGKFIADYFGMTCMELPGLRKGDAGSPTIRKLIQNPKVRKPLLVTHDHVIMKALSDLNGGDTVDTPACAELRILKIDRDSGAWKEKTRIMQSDLDPNVVDIY